jgi:hypothetical protein
MQSARMTVIEIGPHKWGSRVFESPGVEPVFLEKRQAVDYAETRARFRAGCDCKLERTIAFNAQRLPINESRANHSAYQMPNNSAQFEPCSLLIAFPS